MKRDIQAIFIDRDGTIGGNGYFLHPNEFRLYSYSKEALQLIKKSGIKMFAITNQSGIEEGLVEENEIYNQLIYYGFDDVYICPHKKNSNCDCRKPKLGMFKNAANQYNLDLTKCVVIGDMGETDIVAAHNIGALKILVRTGLGEGSLNEFRHTWNGLEVDMVANNILDAVNWILDEGK